MSLTAYSRASCKFQGTILASHAGSQANDVHYSAEPNLPLTKIGKAVSSVVNVNTLNTVIRSLSARVLQALLVVGLAVLFFTYRKKQRITSRIFMHLHYLA